MTIALHLRAGANNPTTPVTPSTQAVAAQTAFEQVAERLRPTIVQVRGRRGFGAHADMDEGAGSMRSFEEEDRDGGPPVRTRPQQTTSIGSGVIVHSDGWILTNDHVVRDADQVIVVLPDGRELSGRVSRDYRSDLALVHINATNLPSAEFADTGAPKIGQWAIAFGAPFGLTDTMTVGIVSSLNREQSIGSARSGRSYFGLIQTDASINPGNSGGPLVDIYGRIIGINVAIDTPSGGNVGIGFAIPASTAHYVADQLMRTGHVTRAYLGLSPIDMSYADRQRTGRTGGVVIQSVAGDSPAGRAGLQEGDIVVKFNGQLVSRADQFRDLVARSQPGKALEIVVLRMSESHQVTKTLPVTPLEAAAPTQEQLDIPMRRRFEPNDDDAQLDPRHG